jgi:hypothetical protein
MGGFQAAVSQYFAGHLPEIPLLTRFSKNFKFF